MAACTVVSKLKTERKTLYISWCIIRTRGTCVARAGNSTLSALRAKQVNLFRKIRASASFLFLNFLFWSRERERTAKSISQSRTISTQIFRRCSYLLLAAKALLLNLVRHPTPCNFSDVPWCLYCILQLYYLARACKYITHAVIGQYSGPDFPVMPTGMPASQVEILKM